MSIWAAPPTDNSSGLSNSTFTAKPVELWPEITGTNIILEASPSISAAARALSFLDYPKLPLNTELSPLDSTPRSKTEL